MASPEVVGSNESVEDCVAAEDHGEGGTMPELEAFNSIEIMLKRVAESEAHFKHQQRGEPDLTFEEKHAIVKDLLHNKPAIFLSRFGKYLVQDDIKNFEQFEGDYVIDFHLKEVQKNLDDKQNQRKVRNRRYEAMKKMLADGEYFSDEEMKRRDPLLYEQMVGQYLSEEEIQSQVDNTDLRFSSIILSHMDMQRNNAIYNIQKDIEEGQIEEEEEEDEEEEEEMEDDEEYPEVSSDQKGESEKWVPSEEEKMMLRQEFQRTMELRFLDGKDFEFNYSDVDTNVEYDSLDIRQQDEEERYFDDETPENISSRTSSVGSLSKKRDEDDTVDYEKYEVNELQGILNTTEVQRTEGEMQEHSGD